MRSGPPVLLVVLLAACGGGEEKQEEASGLADAQRAWQAAGITDYDLAVVRSCFCADAGSVRVRVRDGVAVEVVSTPPGSADPEPTPAEGAPSSVEALHAIVAREEATADRVTVRYDDHGVPLVIDVDRLANAVDDEESFAVTFTRVP